MGERENKMPKGVYVRTEETKRKNNEAQKCKYYSPEARKRMNTAQSGENSPNWKGGCSITYHNLAWKKFGKRHCEICNIGIISHYKKYRAGRRLSMHCLSEDYIVMKAENWLTVCYKCHGKLDLGRKKKEDEC